MADSDRCHACGRLLPADAPQGLCPRCLLQQGMANSDVIPRQADEIASLAAPMASVRRGLSGILGSRPAVLLRCDEVGGDGPGSRLTSFEIQSRPADTSRYRLFGEIARGGMGAILKGRDLDLGRDLAIKILLDQRRDRPELVRRFIEEAQIGGQLQHPGIVPVHELGMLEDERPYFTMKLVRGRTLTALLETRANLSDDRPRFLSIFEQVCQTIAYAHSRGVVHRDLKPSNVMVGSFGEVQVMDWGLAKVLKTVGTDETFPTQPGAEEGVQTVRHDSGVDLSRLGSVLGTPAYMAANRPGVRPIESMNEPTYSAWAPFCARSSPGGLRMWALRRIKSIVSRSLLIWPTLTASFRRAGPKPNLSRWHAAAWPRCRVIGLVTAVRSLRRSRPTSAACKNDSSRPSWRA